MGRAQDTSFPHTEMCPLRNWCTKSGTPRRQRSHGEKYRRWMEAERAHGKGQGEAEGSETCLKNAGN